MLSSAVPDACCPVLVTRRAFRVLARPFRMLVSQFRDASPPFSVVDNALRDVR